MVMPQVVAIATNLTCARLVFASMMRAPFSRGVRR